MHKMDLLVKLDHLINNTDINFDLKSSYYNDNKNMKCAFLRENIAEKEDDAKSVKNYKDYRMNNNKKSENGRLDTDVDSTDEFEDCVIFYNENEESSSSEVISINEIELDDCEKIEKFIAECESASDEQTEDEEVFNQIEIDETNNRKVDNIIIEEIELCNNDDEVKVKDTQLVNKAKEQFDFTTDKECSNERTELISCADEVKLIANQTGSGDTENHKDEFTTLENNTNDDYLNTELEANPLVRLTSNITDDNLTLDAEPNFKALENRISIMWKELKDIQIKIKEEKKYSREARSELNEYMNQYTNKNSSISTNALIVNEIDDKVIDHCHHCDKDNCADKNKNVNDSTVHDKVENNERNYGNDINKDDNHSKTNEITQTENENSSEEQNCNYDALNNTKRLVEVRNFHSQPNLNLSPKLEAKINAKKEMYKKIKQNQRNTDALLFEKKFKEVDELCTSELNKITTIISQLDSLQYTSEFKNTYDKPKKTYSQVNNIKSNSNYFTNPVTKQSNVSLPDPASLRFLSNCNVKFNDFPNFNKTGNNSFEAKSSNGDNDLQLTKTDLIH